MNDIKNFDNMLKSCLNIEKCNFTSSKDIFDEAWVKRNKIISNNEKTIKYCWRKVALTYVCCTFVFFVAVVCISSSGKNMAYAAYNSLRSIFVLDKSQGDYKIVSKSENEMLHHETIGGIQINDLNRSKLEKSIGFKLNFPEKVGEDFKICRIPSIGITVYDIRLMNLEGERDKFIKSVEDNELFEKLNKRYEMKKFALVEYSDAESNNFILHLADGKEKTMSNSKTIKEINIEGINCTVIEKVSAVYEKRYEDGFYCDDYTQKPGNTIKSKYIFWNYNGVSYGITGSENFNTDRGIKFAAEYIKTLKLQ